MTLPSTLKISSLRLLLISALVSSTLVALNSTSWFLLWAALEINMISFLPLLFFSRQSKTWNNATEYFFPQAAGSLLILIAAILTLLQSNEPQLKELVILAAMLLKGGFAPFHYWFISVFSNTQSWTLCFILSTWQKLVPIFTLSFISAPTNPTITLSLALLGATWAMAMAANQTDLQKFIAYSSVGNLGWFLALSPTSATAAASFFVLYSILLATLLSLLSLLSPDTLLLSSSHPLISLPQKLALTLCLLSLAGFPPTTGFLMKIWVLTAVSQTSFLFSWALTIPLLLSMAAYARFLFYFLYNHHSNAAPQNSHQTSSSWAPLILSISVHCSPAALALLPSVI